MGCRASSSAASRTERSTRSLSARKPTRSIVAATYEFDTAKLRFLYSSPATPQQTVDYDMATRERPYASSRRCRAAMIHPPTWCAGCSRAPPTTNSCRSPCCTARVLRSTVPRRCFSKLWRLRLRVRGLVRSECAVAGRPRVRLRDRPYPRRPREGRALAQGRAARHQGELV